MTLNNTANGMEIYPIHIASEPHRAQPSKNSPYGRFFHPSEGKAFSSEGYQRNASGPFAARFRAMIGDPNSSAYWPTSFGPS